MAVPISAETLYESACEFAQTALDAHHVRNFRRVTLDAGTALEHLAKACLAARSSALLADLRGEAGFPSLVRLLDIKGGKPPRLLRTVGLRDALTRVKMFVKSDAADADLRTLVDMRDGTVHAAQSDEVEERLVVAFVQHANALLADLDRDRPAFWGRHLAVVDALLSDVSDKVARDVTLKLAAAAADFARQYGAIDPEVLRAIRRVAVPDLDPDQEQAATCPSCASAGAATGIHDVEWRDVEGRPGEKASLSALDGIVSFTADSFECRICGLHLNSPAELAVAGIEQRWTVENADPYDYDPPLSTFIRPRPGWSPDQA